MVKLLLKYDSLLPLIGALVILSGMVFNVLDGEMANYNCFSNAELLDWLVLGPFWLTQLLAAIAALGVAFFLNRLVQTQSLLGRISNLPFFIISLLFILLPSEYNHPVFWIGCMIQILFIKQTLHIFSGEKITYEIFNQGLTIGTLAIFNPSFLAYYLISVRALVLSARFDFKKAVIILIAIGSSLYILNGALYLLSEDLVLYSFSYESDWVFNDTMDFIRVALLLIVLVVSFFNTRAQLSKATMREKRRWSLISLALLIGVLSIVSFNYGYWLFTILVPLCIAFSRALIFIKNKWLAELFFMLFLGLIYLFKIGA